MDTNSWKDKGFLWDYKVYIVIALMGICAALPHILEAFLENKEGNLIVSFREAPTDLILVISIILILISWIFRKRKALLISCVTILIIANTLLLQTFTIVNKEGIERRSFNFTKNEYFKWSEIDEIHFSSKLSKDIRPKKYGINNKSKEPLVTTVVPSLEIKMLNEATTYNGFTTAELLNLKEWLKVQSQPKTYIQPIPEDYQDYFFKMRHDNLVLMNQLFEIDVEFNDKAILIN